MNVSTRSPIKTQTRKIDGLSIRYAESEPRDVSAILLSPWPESLFTFEQMWLRLAQHAHVVAIDLPGFGHSERRNDLLTSSAMGKFIAHVVEEFELTRPHAVGPDIGTSALLFTAAKHPGLLRSIVIGNGTAEQLPHSKSDKIDAGHFAWADAADQYATLIIDWWNGGYERV
jgi:pimeloyl-ACP methyl ester carboxylesterase